MSRPFNGISGWFTQPLAKRKVPPALYQWHKVLIDCYAVACFAFCSSSWKKLRFEFWSWRGRLACRENVLVHDMHSVVRNPIGDTCMGIYGRRTEHNRLQSYQTIKSSSSNCKINDLPASTTITT